MSTIRSIGSPTVAWLGLLLAVALVAAACGPAEPTPTPTPTATATPSKAATEAAPKQVAVEVEPTSTPEPATALEPTPVSGLAQVAAGGPGKIAFISNRDGNPEIYVMNDDGSNQTRLTNHPAGDASPTWSPDGSRIAFQSDRDGNQEIYVMNDDGTNVTRLTNNPDLDISPAWSPDGTRIAYVSRKGERIEEIYVMGPDGSNPIRLTFNLAKDLAPVWSSDGARIAFLSERQDIKEIYVMNADGSNQAPLMDLQRTAGGLFHRHNAPAWSPGTRIAFNSRTGESHEIYVVNADGTGQTRLTNSPEHVGFPTWSPDGTKIAFTSGRDEDGDIYVMNADGTGTVRLTTHPGMDGLPDWVPGSVPATLVTAPTPTPSIPTPTPAATVPRLAVVGTALTEAAESPVAGVHINGNYAYVGSQNIGYEAPEHKTGIRILDISDPTKPQLVGRIPLRSVEFGSEAGGGGSDDAPHSHGDAVATTIDSAAFQGDIAIVLHGVPDTFGVEEYQLPFGIWDVTDPADPQFLSPLNLGNFFEFDILGDKPADTKAVKGHYFYTIYSLGEPVHGAQPADKHLAVVDLSDPRNPVKVGDWQDTRQVHLRALSVNAAGTRVYIVGQFGKELLIYVLDVQDPTNPVELARFVWPYPFAGNFSPGRPVANADDSVVIFPDGNWDCGRASRLHVLDTSDLADIREVSTIAFPESDVCRRGPANWYWAHDLAINGNLVYSTWQGGGLLVTDISDPANPLKVARFLSPNGKEPWLSDVDLYGDLAVTVAVWAPGLYILRPSTIQSAETVPAEQEPKPAPAQRLADDSTALQPILGRWEGFLQLSRGDLEIIVDFSADEDGVHGSMISPRFDGSRTLANIRFDPPAVYFEDGEGGVYDGELAGDTISGTAELSRGSAPFSLKRTGDGR